jgi:hypothetical protein
MNERIEKLSEQATEYANEQNELHGVGYVITFKEKFAELIVLECSSICYKGLENGDEAASLLMNTFGVEE